MRELSPTHAAGGSDLIVGEAAGELANWFREFPPLRVPIKAAAPADDASAAAWASAYF